MIQGIGNPVVMSTDGTIHSGVALELKFCDEIFPNFEKRTEIKKSSIFNGFNHYVNRWTHWEFRWIIHLYEAIRAGEAAPYNTPAAYFAELLNLLDCNFKLKAHKYEYNYTDNEPSAVAVANWIQSKHITFGTGSSGTSIVLDEAELNEDDYLNGLNITWNGTTKAIIDYVGSTHTATIASPFASDPVITDEYTIDVFFHCKPFKLFYLEDLQRADCLELIVESMRPVDVDQIAT